LMFNLNPDQTSVYQMIGDNLDINF